MNAPASLLWFRLDLRLADNPALCAATACGAPVIPVFIWAPEEEAPWPPGAASRAWLNQSVRALEADLANRGSRLIIRRGPTLEAMRQLIIDTGAGAVFWHRRCEPAQRLQEIQVMDLARSRGVEAGVFNGALLHEPSALVNKGGRPFRVFTPFWRTWLDEADPPVPLPVPRRLPAPKKWPDSLPLAALELRPRLPWEARILSGWRPGTGGAMVALERFLTQALLDYPDRRDFPGHTGTSRLSPHLHFGEISPRQAWHAIRQFAEARSIPVQRWQHWQFITELGWREFAHHVLWHFPYVAERPLHEEYARFPWREDATRLAAWQHGITGVPLVDAGMRELWATGWMHNRARMIAASFLAKNLLISWHDGARWFWDTLVDADLANNTLGWQWSSGCGADAAPFFRVFNPVTQGERFDADGHYTQSWVPELARLPRVWIHRPWKAPATVLESAGIELGQTYPEPIVNLAISRAVALDAFRRFKARQ